MRSAVFLDLQGTLGGDGLGDIRDFTFYPPAIPALDLLNQTDLLTIIVTNQSHIEKGLLTYEHYELRVREITQELESAGVHYDAIYCCPHRGQQCLCRKPRLGLIHEAQKAFGIALQTSYVVGDMGSSDIVMAHNMGSKGVLVRTGAGKSSLAEYRHTWADAEPSFVADDVLQAVKWIIQDRASA